MKDVISKPKHLSPRLHNDKIYFYGTTYSTSYNKDISPSAVKRNVNSGFVTNNRPYVSLTATADDLASKLCDQYTTVAGNDFKPFKYPNGLEITPIYLLKGNLSRFGKEELITPPTNQVFNMSDVKSETSYSYCKKDFQSYDPTNLFISNEKPNKRTRQLGEQTYDFINVKEKLAPWDNEPVSAQDYIDPFLHKSIKHRPLINESATRITGITLPKALSGEDWYPFDRKIEKSTSQQRSVEPLGSIPKLHKQQVKRDPTKIINSIHPRLVSMQKAEYSWPEINGTKSQKRKNSMPSAYSLLNNPKVSSRTPVFAENYTTETGSQFVDKSAPELVSRGYVFANPVRK